MRKATSISTSYFLNPKKQHHMLLLIGSMHREINNVTPRWHTRVNKVHYGMESGHDATCHLICYGLNYVLLSTVTFTTLHTHTHTHTHTQSPNSHVSALNLQLDGIWRWDPWEIIRLDEVTRVGPS